MQFEVPPCVLNESVPLPISTFVPGAAGEVSSPLATTWYSRCRAQYLLRNQSGDAVVHGSKGPRARQQLSGHAITAAATVPS